MRSTTLRHTAVGLLTALLGGVALWSLAGLAPLWAWLVAINATTVAMYAYDKRQARRAAWRVPENALHVLAFAGGSPGALAAQRFLRHKSAKRSFQVAFWLILVAQVLALAWWFLR